MIFPKREEDYHRLQPLLDKAAAEQKTLGAPSKKTLLLVAECLVRFAPNMFTPLNAPSYSDEEKEAAKALLRKYGFGRFVNLSPRFKQNILRSIREELAEET